MSHASIPETSLFLRVAFPLLAAATLAAIALAIGRASPNPRRHVRGFAVGAVLWLGFTALLAKSGFLSQTGLVPPPFLILVVPMLILSFALGLSRLGEAVAMKTPLAALVAFHAFRLPLELVMHRAAADGVMPDQMTFTGANFDIATGVTALLLAPALAFGNVPRSVVVAWNALGSALLLAIIVIAIASMPTFHAFGADPARMNTWVQFFPFVWLPAALVTSAIFGHVVLWRRLLHGSLSTKRHAALPPSHAAG
jgi:hypothetical protein